jgi:branched-chain amino acid transport system substrate-binding protein
MHYLQAVQAADTDDTDAVMAKMRAMPVKDFFASNGHLRPDGLMVHDMYMFQVKTPEESSGPWDYYKLLATVPADQVSPPLAASTCPLVKT